MNRVIIVDDGVEASSPLLQKQLYCDFLVNHNCELVDKREMPPANRAISHGTVCAAIINKKHPSVQIGSMQVIDPETNSGKPERLVAALIYLQCIDVEIIHMSIGTTDLFYQAEISLLIHVLKKQGKLLVAAANNLGCYCLPASLLNVHSVACTTRNSLFAGVDCLRATHCIDGVDYQCNGNHTLKLSDQTEYETGHANSFAAPILTAMIAKKQFNGFQSKYESGCFSFDFPASFYDLCNRKVCTSYAPDDKIDAYNIEKWKIIESTSFWRYFFNYRQNNADHNWSGIVLIGAKRISLIKKLYLKSKNLRYYLERKHVDLRISQYLKHCERHNNTHTLELGSLCIEYHQDTLPYALDLLEKISQSLHRFGYSYIVYSDIPHATLHGFEPLADEFDIKRVLEYTNDKYDIDCVLFLQKGKLKSLKVEFAMYSSEQSTVALPKVKNISFDSPIGKTTFNKIKPLLIEWMQCISQLKT